VKAPTFSAIVFWLAYALGVGLLTVIVITYIDKERALAQAQAQAQAKPKPQPYHRTWKLPEGVTAIDAGSVCIYVRGDAQVGGRSTAIAVVPKSAISWDWKNGTACSQ
jgi:Flp pilus assembly protein protease CpaA